MRFQFSRLPPCGLETSQETSNNTPVERDRHAYTIKFYRMHKNIVHIILQFFAYTLHTQYYVNFNNIIKISGAILLTIKQRTPRNVKINVKQNIKKGV